MANKIPQDVWERFLALYWNQEVATNDGVHVSKVDDYILNRSSWFDLILRDLADITDEHVIEVAKILDFTTFGDGLIVERLKDKLAIYDKYNDYPHKEDNLFIHHDIEIYSLDDNGKVFQYDFERLLMVADFLRSKSYLLPYGGYSAQDWIDSGRLKLKSKICLQKTR